MTATRVLIVDDNPHVRQDLSTLLPLLGDIEVVGQAGDGEQAVQQTEALHPDVVLLDLEMPVLDGYEAARQIKARCPTIRVVALTAYGSSAARERARQAGVDDLIEKGAPGMAIVRALQSKIDP